MKNELRKKYIEERKNIIDNQRKTAGEIVYNKLIMSEMYENAESIFIYVSMKTEMSTINIINKALEDNKMVAVPVTLSNRDMYFVNINSLNDMVKTKFGTLEPICSRKDEVFPDNKTLLVVPGTAFDIKGHRMGFGGGYYDTYIEKFDINNTLALAFDIQLKESIPYETHDKIMKYIITEKRIIEN